MVDLIPGTALPIHTPAMAPQPEGRGGVQIIPERAPVSMIETIEDPDYLDAAERIHAAAALRAVDRAPKFERTVFAESSDQCDVTTGNLVLQLFEVPQGMEAHLALLLVDTPRSTTINPSAPYANAASFSFIGIDSPSTSDNDALAPAARPSMVAFAPTSAAGPILPGQWTFNDSNAPVAFGGSMFYYVIVGGSIAALSLLTVRAKYRVNLYSHV